VRLVSRDAMAYNENSIIWLGVGIGLAVLGTVLTLGEVFRSCVPFCAYYPGYQIPRFFPPALLLILVAIPFLIQSYRAHSHRTN
jgi:hypothetical protein